MTVSAEILEGTKVRVTTSAHPRCALGRVGHVVPCTCGHTHPGTIIFRPVGSKSRYRFAPTELEVVE